MRLLRAQVLHTPRSPFVAARALEAFADGAVALEGPRIAAVGDYASLRRTYPEAESVDLRPGVLLPGFVDAHVHYPQVHAMGSMGLGLLPWLERRALPAERRLADPQRARAVARHFLQGLIRSGTTAALVFGAHFPGAHAIFFEEAARLGLLVASGLVLSDRNLGPDLHQDPEEAYRASLALARRWHGHGGLRYAVSPRFALSTSPAMLEVASTLLRELPGALLQTHLNETPEEIAAVRRLFPNAPDYLAVYEEFGLLGARSVFAHNLYPSARELAALAAAGAAVAHCPSSNAFLGSGLFPLARHLEQGVQIALGTDVGAGTGFGLLKEGLMAYLGQQLRPDGYPLGPAHLLYLATRAGALALGLGDEAGDLLPGRRADLVLVRPPRGSVLETILAHSASPEETLGALFTLAREESVAAVYVAGEAVLDSAGQELP